MMIMLHVLLMTIMLSYGAMFGMEKEKESRQSLIERLGDQPNGIWAREYEKQGWTIDQALHDHRKENPSFYELMYHRHEKLKEIIERSGSQFESIAPKIRELAQKDKGWKQLVDRKCHTECLLYYINANLTNQALFKNGFDRSVRNEDMYIYLELAAVPLGTKGAIEFGKEFIQQDSAKQRLKNFVFEIVKYGGSRPGSCEMMLSWPNEDRDVAEAALKMGLDLNVSEGKRPLLITAVEAKKAKVVELLLEKGADKDISYAYETEYAEGSWQKVPSYVRSYKALHVASQYNYQDIVDLLIKHGANVNALDNFGRTPLLLAAQNSHPAVMLALLAAGADDSAKDASSGKYTIDYVAEVLDKRDALADKDVIEYKKIFELLAEPRK